MNKNGWATFILNFIFLHYVISRSSIAVYKSGLASVIAFMLVELGVALYINGYILDGIKAEHFKHIDNPHHWSHKPYQSYFVDEDLKLF